jgi:hypothetical protein
MKHLTYLLVISLIWLPSTQISVAIEEVDAVKAHDLITSDITQEADLEYTSTTEKGEESTTTRGEESTTIC